MDASLIAYLLLAASRLTGLPAVEIDELPTFVALPASELERQVCVEENGGCSGMAAYFDALHYRILYSENLDLEDPVDHSFLLHELVHVLQHRQVGNTMYADCRAVVQTERQAYRAQNAYINSYGRLVQMGNLLTMSYCPPGVG